MKSVLNWWIVRLLISKAVMCWEMFKRPGRFKKSPVLKKHQTVVEIHHIEGFSLKIHIHKTVFSQNYNRWFITARSKAVYDVFAVASNDAPEKLKEVTLVFRRSFPTMFPDYVPEDVQRKYVLDAYLDVLLQLYRDKLAKPS